MTKREAMKQLRWRQNAEAFTHKLEECVKDRPFFMPANIKPPSDLAFAHSVLTGFVTGLQRDET
jgi:hypothetical protein